MADLHVFRPEAGRRMTLGNVADARLVLGFAPDEAVLSREGDSLVFSFEDGGSVALENFYAAYTGESLPDFEIEGLDIAGADFFAALDPSLMPAAGPAATAPQAGRHDAEWTNSALFGGIDRLDGLDLGMGFRERQDEHDGGAGRDDGDVNGMPSILFVDAAAVVEAGVHVGGNEVKAGVPVFHGQVSALDPDGDRLSYGFLDASGNVTSSITTEWGTISIDPAAGTFTYTLNNDSAESLAEGDTRRESFTVQVSDGRGGTATANVNVIITGTNDVPTLELTDERLSVGVDDMPDVTGNISDRGAAMGDDPDAGHELHYSFGTDERGEPVTSITDEYGTLTIDPDTGGYVYTLNRDSDAVKALKGDGTDDVRRSVTVVVTDEYGAHAERELVIVIRGANEAPEITYGKSSLVLEESGVVGAGMEKVDGVMNDGGSFTVFDKDANDAHELSVTIEGLVQGRDYTVSTDPDSGVTTVATAYGVLVITPSVAADKYGSTTVTYRYVFNLSDENNPGYGDAAGRLNEGETQELPFRLTVTDHAGASVSQDVKVTITGTNDAPELKLSHTNLVIGEDETGGGLHTVLDDDADGALTDGETVNHRFSIAHRPGENDDDTADRSVPSADFGDAAVFETMYGTLTVNADGSYTFTPSDAAQNLGEGEDVTLNFDITVTDRHGAHDTESVTVVLRGTNDRPVADGESGTLVLKESGVGDRTVTGIDDGWAEGPDQAKINGTAVDDGSFTVHETDADDTLTLTVKDADGNAVTLLRDPATGELYVKDACGILFITENTVTNPDGSHDTTYGYRYELDNEAVNGLRQYDEREGAEHVEGVDHYSGKYTFSVTDGRSDPVEHEVDILIKGTNDGPKVEYSKVHLREEGVFMENGNGNTATTDDGGDNGHVFPENHRVEVSGHVNVSDPDQQGGFELSVKLGDTFGTGNPVKHYQGSGNSSAPFVDAAGNPYQSEIVVNPQGSSDSENVQIIETNYGTLTFHKQDWTETLDDGSFVTHKAGDYTFALNGDAAQNLAKGEKLDFNFTVTATDEHGAQGHHQIGVTIEGSNDVPDIILRDDERELVVREAGTGVDDSKSTDGGTADSTDDDHNAGRSFGFTLGDASDARVHTTLYMDRDGNLLTDDNEAACVGRLVINPSTGEYHFELFNDRAVVQEMNNGDVIEPADGVTVNVRVTDEHGAHDQEAITVRVEGTNDAPRATASGLTVKEDGVFGGNVDTVADRDGNLLNGEHRFGADGQIRVQDVDDDLSGGSAGGDWKYAGEGDGFTFKLVSSEHIQVNGNGLSAEYMLSGSGDFKTVWGQIGSGTFPQEQLARLNEALRTAVEGGSLNVSDSLKSLIRSEDFDIAKVSDDEARSILSDISLGTLTLDSDTGKYTFTTAPEGSLGALINNIFGAGYGSNRTFGVEVTDPNGGSTTTAINVTIKGTNDRPELKLEDNPDHDVTDQTDMVATGSLSALDPDAGDKHTYFIVRKDADGNDVTVNGEALNQGNHGFWESQGQGILNNATSTTVEGRYGTLVITKDANGKPVYEYHVNHDKVAGLSGEDKVEESFSIVVRDSGGAFDIKDVTFTVTGTDDGPKLTVATADAHVLEVKEFGVVPGGNTLNNSTGVASGNFNIQWTDNNAEGEQNQHFGFMLNGRLLSAVDGNGTPVTTTGQANGHSYSIVGTGDGAGSSLEISIDGVHYGTLSIDAGGKFTFELDHDALNGKDENWHTKLFDFLGDSLKLVAWDDRHDAFNPDGTVNDAGKLADQKLDIYFDGANDRPVFDQAGGAVNATLHEDGVTWTAGNNGISFTENDGQRTIQGKLGGNDVDANADGEYDHFTFAIVKPDGSLVQKIEGKYGILELRPDGSYTYTLTVPENEFEHLNKDQLLQAEGFDVRITDEHGASTQGKFRITVAGEHDDFKLSADNLTVTENNGALSSEEDLTHSKDGGHKLEGVDQEDIDSIAGGDVTWGAEGGKPGENGTIVVEGEYGKLVLDPATGKYHYELDNSKIQEWNSEGSNAKSDTEQFTIQVTVNGTTVDKVISVTVNGANDRPKWMDGVDDFTGVAKPFVKDADHKDDNADMRFEGTVSGGTDIDDSSVQYMLTDGSTQANGDFSTSAVIKTDYGSFTIDPVTGEYTYTVDSYSSRLAEYFKNNPDKDTFTDTIKVVVVDPHGAQSETTREIQISIGRNDLPGGPGSGPEYVDGDLAGTVVEDGDSDQDDMTRESVSGQLKANVDASDPSVFFGVQGANGQTQTGMIEHPEPVNGKYGYITVDPATGEWTYTLFNGENGSDNPVQNLPAGETVEEEFTVMLNGKVVTDDQGNPVKITITITGTNDAPEITHADAEKLITGVEGGVLSAEGTITATDVDRDDAGKMEDLTARFDNGTDTMVGKYGTITLVEGENGKWTYTYTLDPAKLEADPEASKYFCKDADGTWHLIAGTNLNDKFTVHITDGTATVDQEITIKIDGQNFAPEPDASVGSVTGTGVTEDGFPVGSNTVESVIAKGDLAAAFTDDQGTGNLHFVFADGKTFMEDPDGYGTWQIDNDGNVVFTLNNQSAAVQGLGEGDIWPVSVEVYARDEHGKLSEEGVNVKVTIEGTADVPQLIIEKALAVTEASRDGGTAEGEFHIVDPDAADSRENLTYTVTGSDKDGNELADVDGNSSVTAEGGQKLTFVNEYGTLVLDPSTGRYSFELNSDSDAVRAMKPGELYEIRFDVTVRDHDDKENTGQIVVNIKGTNTAPEIDADVSIFGNAADAPIREDAAGADATFSGIIAAGDVDGDEGDRLGYGFALTEDQKADGWRVSPDGKTLTTTYGTVRLNDSGEYVYTLDSKRADGLAEGERTQESFRVVVTDRYGAQSEASVVTINIEGANDAPKIESSSLTHNADGVYTGRLSFSDADVRDTHTVTFAGLFDAEGKPLSVDLGAMGNGRVLEVYDEGNRVGTLSLDFARGTGTADSLHYTFTPDTDYTGSMNRGEDLRLDFSITVNDGHDSVAQENLSIAISSSNAAPELGEPRPDSAGANAGELRVSDADSSNVTLTIALVGLGSMEIPQNGQEYAFGDVNFRYENGILRYVIAGVDTDAMAPGGEGTLKFTVTLDDGHGMVTQNVSLPVYSTNEAPTVEGVSLDVDGDILRGELIGVSDDHSEELSFGLDEDNAPQYGTVQLNADGSFTYAPDDEIPAGADSDSFTIMVDDGYGGVAAQEINVSFADYWNPDDTEGDEPLFGDSGEDYTVSASEHAAWYGGEEAEAELLPEEDGGELGGLLDGILTEGGVEEPDGREETEREVPGKIDLTGLERIPGEETSAGPAEGTAGSGSELESMLEYGGNCTAASDESAEELAVQAMKAVLENGNG